MMNQEFPKFIIERMEEIRIELDLRHDLNLREIKNIIEVVAGRAKWEMKRYQINLEEADPHQEIDLIRHHLHRLETIIDQKGNDEDGK